MVNPNNNVERGESLTTLDQEDTVLNIDKDDGDLSASSDILSSSSSSLIGCIALVAGTTVGAGILALPAKTISIGFLPTVVLLVLGWFYMVATGLLIAECNVTTVCTLDDRDAVSIPTMVQETLGRTGSITSSIAFVFLHIALITAYILQGGSLLVESMILPIMDTTISSLNGDIVGLSTFGPFLFASTLGLILVGLTTRQVEWINNIMVAGVVIIFGSLVVYGIPQVNPTLLFDWKTVFPHEWKDIIPVLPILPVVYVYQTVVPTICTLLQCNVSQIRTAIIVGTAIPMTMFISWSYVILGIVPSSSNEILSGSDGGGYDTIVDPLLYLRQGSTNDTLLGQLILVFSLLAVATSFLGFTYGLIDFYADLFRWDGTLSNNNNNNQNDDYDEENSMGNNNDLSLITRTSSSTTTETNELNLINDEEMDDSDNNVNFNLSQWIDMVGDKLFIVPQSLRKWFLLVVAIGPPICIATWNSNNPSLFFDALDNAGVYGILVLFGLLPPIMAWKQRYPTNAPNNDVQEEEDYYFNRWLDRRRNGNNDLIRTVNDKNKNDIMENKEMIQVVEEELVPGGKVILTILAGTAIGIIGLETLEKFSLAT